MIPTSEWVIQLVMAPGAFRAQQAAALSAVGGLYVSHDR
ncbi:hypothetical protein LMG24235_07030 [Paraburkholderia sabiae]|nr:hypothetical protein LMG24235_07030 [Paraburkholderia sabiae]